MSHGKNMSTLWGTSTWSILLACWAALSGCLGTEVGNGLKPKDEDKDKRGASKVSPTETANSDVAPLPNPQEQGAVMAPDSLTSIAGLLFILSNSCANPLALADQVSFDLLDNRDPAATNVKRIGASWENDRWVLAGDGADSVRLAVNAANSPTVEARNVRTDELLTGFSCRDFDAVATANLDGTLGNWVASSAKVLHPRLPANGVIIKWVGSLDGNSAGALYPYQLEQVEVVDAEGKQLIKLFANY